MLKRIFLILALTLIGLGILRAQVSVRPLPWVKSQFFSSAGKPLAYGRICTFTAGTSTPLATYTDSTGVTANANPVVLDAGGYGSIWLTGASYKIVAYAAPFTSCTATGAVWTMDGVSGSALPLRLLDASDGLYSAPLRGAIIRGNSTPAWSRYALGAKGKYLGSDGTDATYSRPFNVRVASDFTGADIGLQIAAAETDLGAAAGEIWVTTPGTLSTNVTLADNHILRFFPGAYTISGTINLNNISNSVICEGRHAVTLTYAGTGKMFSVKTLNVGPSAPLTAGKIEGCAIAGPATNATTGIYIADTTGFRIIGNEIYGFTGTNGRGVWLDNTIEGATQYWTERTIIADNTIENNKIDIDFTVNGGTNSFGYTHIRSTHVNTNSGQTGINVGAGASLYGSSLEISSNSEGTLFNVAGAITESFGVILAESTGGAGTFANVPAGGNFTMFGYVRRANFASDGTHTGSFYIFSFGDHNTQLSTNLGSYGGGATGLLFLDDTSFAVTGRPNLAGFIQSNYGGSAANLLYLFSNNNIHDGRAAVRWLQGNTFGAATEVAKIDSAGTGTFSKNATITNCSSSASPAVCAVAPAGSVVIAATATSVVVNTSAVTANSQIHVTRDNSLGTKLSVTCNTQAASALGTPVVSARSAGTSFTILIETGPTTNPMCLSYSIIN